MRKDSGSILPAIFSATLIAAMYFTTVGYAACERAGSCYASSRLEASAPAVIQFLPPKTAPEISEPSMYLEEANLLTQRWIAWSSLAMLVVTATGVGLVFMTVLQTRGILTEARNATQAANDTVAATRQIGEAQVRAYLSLQSVHARYFPDSISTRKPDFEFVIQIANSGRSPARIVDYTVRARAVFRNMGTKSPGPPFERDSIPCTRKRHPDIAASSLESLLFRGQNLMAADLARTGNPEVRAPDAYTSLHEIHFHFWLLFEDVFQGRWLVSGHARRNRFGPFHIEETEMHIAEAEVFYVAAGDASANEQIALAQAAWFEKISNQD